MIIKLILFGAILKGLAEVDLMVLLAAAGVAIAFVICTDLLLDSPSLR